MEQIEDQEDDFDQEDDESTDESEHESSELPNPDEPREIKRRQSKPRVPKYQREAQKYAQQAIKNLKVIAETSTSQTARIAANKEILDRAVGKPGQKVEVSSTVLNVTYVDTLKQLHHRISNRKPQKAIDAIFEEVPAEPINHSELITKEINPPEPEPISPIDAIAPRPPVTVKQVQEKISVIKRRMEDEKRQAAEKRAELVAKRKAKAAQKAEVPAE